MNELQLPLAPPLPAEVRERALAKVLAEAEPPRRRRGPFLAVAAAVVTTLAVTTSVALLGLGRADLQPLQQPAPGIDHGEVTGPPEPNPAPTDRFGAPIPPVSTPEYDAVMARCAAGVRQAGRESDYPPVDSWKVTGILLKDTWEKAVVVDNAFACYADDTTVHVSATRGVPAGGVEIVRLAPAFLAVLNPQRLSHEVDSLGFWTSPMTLVRLGRAMEPASDFHLTVVARASGSGIERSWNQQMPEPGDIAVTVQDRSPDLARMARPAPAQDLGRCLADNLWKAPPMVPAWTPVLRHEQSGSEPAAVGRVGESEVGFCYADPAGPIFAAGPMPGSGGRTSPGLIVAIRAVNDIRVALVAVPVDSTRVEIAVPGGLATACTAKEGFALCTQRGTAAMEVRIYDPRTPAGSKVGVP